MSIAGFASGKRRVSAPGVPILDEFVEMELRGEDPSTRFPGTAIHLRVCPGCRADHDGLLDAARRFGDLDPA
jgi:hypothetical protein